MTSLLTKQDVKNFIADTLQENINIYEVSGIQLRRLIIPEVSWDRLQNKLPFFTKGEKKRYNIKTVVNWLTDNNINFTLKSKFLSKVLF